MISSHDKNLSVRIEASLLERGFDVAKTPPQKSTPAEFREDPLNGLFSFPYLDFAFVRYTDEILQIELNQILRVFGFCDAGPIAFNSNNQIVLIDDEENFLPMATEIFTFKRLFHLMVSLSTQDAPVSEQDAARLTDLANSPNTGFWGMVAHALCEGDAQPKFHLLTGMKDGKVTAMS